MDFYRVFVEFLVKYEEMNTKAVKLSQDPSLNLQLVTGEGQIQQCNLNEKLKTMTAEM